MTRHNRKKIDYVKTIKREKTKAIERKEANKKVKEKKSH